MLLFHHLKNNKNHNYQRNNQYKTLNIYKIFLINQKNLFLLQEVKGKLNYHSIIYLNIHLIINKYQYRHFLKGYKKLL